jgi:tellurite resistance protein TehA-like permease
MDISRVQRGERVAIYGGILLVVGLFLQWYHLKFNGLVGTTKGPADLTGWAAHPTMRWFLIAGAVAPLILAYIIARDHALSWPRGQMTSVVAIAAFGLVGYTGVVDKPGDSNSLIGLKYGWIVSLLGTVLMLVGSVMRQNETEIRRKPPGTI